MKTYIVVPLLQSIEVRLLIRHTTDCAEQYYYFQFECRCAMVPSIKAYTALTAHPVYALTLASKKEFGLYPVLILRLLRCTDRLSQLYIYILIFLPISCQELMSLLYVVLSLVNGIYLGWIV